MQMRRIALLLALVIIFAAASPRIHAEDTDITNARVIEMAKLGLDDDIIIAKIKNGKCSFQLADSDLVDLKKSGVSSKVVAAMLDASTLTAARVTVDKKAVDIHALAQEKTGG